MDYDNPQFIAAVKKILEAQKEANSPSPDSTPSEEGQESGESLLAVSQIAPSIEGYKETCHCKPEGTPRWKITLEVAAVLVGILVAIIYYGQLEQMRIATEASTQAVKFAEENSELGEGDFNRTMRQMIHQTKAQIDAANAAIESNRINRESLETVQRAFLVWDSHGMDSVHGPGSKVPVYFQYRSIWENTGTTPAPIVIQNFRFDYLGREPTGEEFLGNMQNPLAIAVIGPHGKLDSNTIRQPTAAVFNEIGNPPILAPRNGWYAYGFVAYRDIWNRPHLTESCHKLGMFIPTDDPQFRWDNCVTFNCVDRYCPNYDLVIKYLPTVK